MRVRHIVAALWGSCYCNIFWGETSSDRNLVWRVNTKGCVISWPLVDSDCYQGISYYYYVVLCITMPLRHSELLFPRSKWYWPTPIGSRACEYYRLVDPGSIQGSHRPEEQSIAGEIMGNARAVTTQLAKLSIDRSVELTADVPFFSYL